MANNIFGEFVEWWIESNYRNKDLSEDSSFHASLVELGLIKSNWKIVKKNIIEDWYRDSEEFYTSIGSIDVEFDGDIQTKLLAAFAVVTPPVGISIEERIEIWRDRVDKISDVGVITPNWVLDWKGTIFLELPPHNLFEFFSDFTPSTVVKENLLTSLWNNLRALASLGLLPLDLVSNLRTDGLDVYYCGMGFDLGDTTNTQFEELIDEYENMIFPKLHRDEKDLYLAIKHSWL